MPERGLAFAPAIRAPEHLCRRLEATFTNVREDAWPSLMGGQRFRLRAHHRGDSIVIKSWSHVIKVHPAADLFPVMTTEQVNRELEAELHDAANMSRNCTALVEDTNDRSRELTFALILSKACWSGCSKGICVHATSPRVAR